MLFETQDELEWREYIRRLRASDTQIDWSAARMDTFCGRLTQPTTYRLSLFVRSEDGMISRWDVDAGTHETVGTTTVAAEPDRVVAGSGA